MATNKLTIVAELKDYLTGPVQRGTKALKEQEDQLTATDKAAGRYIDKAGRMREANGRFTSSADRATTKVSKLERALGAAAGDGATKLERALGRLGGAVGRLDADGAASRFSRGMGRMVTSAEGAASKIESAMGRAAKAIGAVTAGVGTASLVGGLSRLNALERADVLLEVNGYDAAGRERIMGTVNESVTGTPFGLDQGATAAAQYLAAGVTEDDLDNRLGLTGDVAALTGADYNEISALLSKVDATGKLQGEELAMLEDRGLNVTGALAEAMGVDRAQARDMISDGKVSAEDFFAALEPTVEGGAAKLGETFYGRWMNLRAAFSRGGASFLKPVLGPLGDAFAKLGAVVDTMGPGLTAAGAALGEGISGAADHLPALVAAVAPLGPPLLNLFESLAGALPEIVQGFIIWGGVLSRVLGPVADVAGFLIDWLAPALPVLIPLLLGVGAGFTGLKVARMVTPLLGGVSKAFAVLGRVIMAHPLLWVPLAIYTVAKGMKWLYDNVEPVRVAFDWLNETMRGVFDTFTDIGNKIDELVDEKFPALNQALKYGSGATAEDDRSWGTRLTDGGSALGEAWGLPDLSGGERADKAARFRERGFFTGGYTGDVPTTSEAGVVHGQEFVTNAWATSKLRSSHPGALEYMNRTGTPPVIPAPAPPTVAPVYNVSVTGAHDPVATARAVAAELERRERARGLTYATPTIRGAY